MENVLCACHKENIKITISLFTFNQKEECFDIVISISSHNTLRDALNVFHFGLQVFLTYLEIMFLGILEYLV